MWTITRGIRRLLLLLVVSAAASPTWAQEVDATTLRTRLSALERELQALQTALRSGATGDPEPAATIEQRLDQLSTEIKVLARLVESTRSSPPSG